MRPAGRPDANHSQQSGGGRPAPRTDPSRAESQADPSRADPSRDAGTTPARPWWAGAAVGAVGAWALGLAANRSLRGVDGPSMLPTLAPDDHLVTAPTWLVAPRRGDVVVLAPGVVGPTPAVKRLVGLPGERVVVLDGHLFVDGSWWRVPGATPVDADHVLEPDEAQVVVLGDNQPRSTDSRRVGPVPTTAVERVALARRSPWRWLRPPVGLRRHAGPRRRDAVRVVVVDPEDRTLLFRVADVDGRRPDWWETPGGGLQPGEDVRAAARRELAEEVGHDDVEVVALDHVAERDSVLHGAPLHRVETTMATRVPDDTVSTAGWTPSEQADHVDWHWFTHDELVDLEAVTHPSELARLLTRAIELV